MRTIKFRGKDNHGKWRKGCYVKFEGLQGAIYYPIYHRMQGDKFNLVKTDWCYVDESTVGQYTGLRDKSGKEIFEGDIVQTKSYGYMAIEYQGGAWILRDKDCFWLSLEEYDDNAALTENLNSVEVVGNIHDNPELLKHN